MKLSDFNYHLPKHLIAQRPANPRDSSRFMVVNRSIQHRRFKDLVDCLQKGDVLVVNDTKVLPAKLTGFKPTGGRVRVLLIKKEDDGRWRCFLQGRIRSGITLNFNGASAEVGERGDDGSWLVHFNTDPLELMHRIGEMPLPPYIKTHLENPQQYQTIYAAKEGSIAAPTAGLHFTPQLIRKIRERGVTIVPVTLHVGVGTFQPVKVEDITRHKMHAEYVTVTGEAADAINQREGRVIAVGTTTLRALEAASKQGVVGEYNDWCDLFIYPPYTFQSPTDALITNFHLPRSTLLMLVVAFAGRNRVMQAYHTAIKTGYRFYSFGDAMLLFKEE
jgi:S-adenosylmethionine:tRNA ribosyltransferase-isomerase